MKLYAEWRKTIGMAIRRKWFEIDAEQRTAERKKITWMNFEDNGISLRFSLLNTQQFRNCFGYEDLFHKRVSWSNIF